MSKTSQFLTAHNWHIWTGILMLPFILGRWLVGSGVHNSCMYCKDSKVIVPNGNALLSINHALKFNRMLLFYNFRTRFKIQNHLPYLVSGDWVSSNHVYMTRKYAQGHYIAHWAHSALPSACTHCRCSKLLESSIILELFRKKACFITILGNMCKTAGSRWSSDLKHTPGHLVHGYWPPLAFNGKL